MTSITPHNDTKELRAKIVKLKGLPETEQRKEFSAPLIYYWEQKLERRQ